MGITYAGVDLLLEDRDGTLATQLAKYASIDRTRFWNPIVGDMSNRAGGRFNDREQVGLGRPNYPPEPPVWLNTLWWPSGASRWGRFYGLVTNEELDEIFGNTENGAEAATLVIEDEANGVALNVQQMSMLPPFQISAVGNDCLYLICLVDQRYWWQFRDVHDLAIFGYPSEKTWDELLQDIGTAMGFEWSPDEVNSDYGYPDPDELNRDYANAAVMIDAMLHSVGRRFTLGLDGTPYADDINTAMNDLEQNQNRDYDLMLGGNSLNLSWASAWPAKVRVVFRKYYWGHPNTSVTHRLYIKDELASDYARNDGQSGMIKTIFTTAFADFSKDDTDPDNVDEVDALAARIAQDYYDWLSERYDLSFAGLLKWTPCGFDDAIEWCYGRMGPGGEYVAYTRVQSLPFNFGVDEMLQQFTDCPVFTSPANFKLTHLLSATTDLDTPNAKHLDTANNGDNTQRSAMIYDLSPIGTFGNGAANQWVLCFWNDDKQKWQVQQKDC